MVGGSRRCSLRVNLAWWSGFYYSPTRCTHRGGPMKYADTVGLPKVLADIREFAKEDPIFWKPSPLLVQLVERGADFASLNQSE